MAAEKTEETTKFISLSAVILASIAESFELLAEGNDTRLIRAHLMIEELSEVLLALARGKDLPLLDGLTDLLYVTVGTAVAYDLPLTESFDEVQRSNMTKTRRIGDVRCRDKGVSYSPPDLKTILTNYKNSM